MNPQDEKTLDLIVDSIFAKCAFSASFMHEWRMTPANIGAKLIAERQGVTDEVANRVQKRLKCGFRDFSCIGDVIRYCEAALKDPKYHDEFANAEDRVAYVMPGWDSLPVATYIVEFMEYNLNLAPNKPIDEVTDANLTIQEDNTMTTKFFETKHFLNAQDISQMSDEQIYAAISKKEADIAKLEAINTKPKRLIAQIEEAKGELAALIAHLDKE